MVSVAVVRMSELGDRWDAQFHIARIELQDRVSELRSTIGEEEAIRRVGEVPFTVRKHLAILVRGSGTDHKAIARATREYPHLALALVERDLSPAVQALREEISKYDDEHGSGYCFVVLPDSETEAVRYSVCDMWVVDEEGNVHPGYSACPVPMLLSDVDLGSGIRKTLDLPEPRSSAHGF